jgi:WD40 repeat protein
MSLISSSYYGDRKVYVWDLATGKLLRQFPGNYHWKRIALSRDGKTLAVGQGDAVVLWDPATGKEVRRLQGHKDGAFGFAFSPDGKTVASGGLDQTIRLWDLAGGKEIAHFPALQVRVSLLAFTPDGKTLISGDHLDRSIHLWDVASHKHLRELAAPNVPLCIVLSPDGTTLAAGSQEGTIPLWDLRTGKLIRKLNGWGWTPAVAFSPDGKTLAASEFNSKLKEYRGALGLWDVATGKRLRRLESRSWSAQSLAFSTDGKTVITGDGTAIRRWDLATGHEQGPAGNLQQVNALALSPDGRTLAYLTGNDIRLRDLAGGREIGTLSAGRSSDVSLAFSPDGKTLAAGGFSNPIQLWDAGSRKLLRRLEGGTTGTGLALGHSSAVGFAPDGKTLAGAGRDGSVRLWDPATGKERGHLSLKEGSTDSRSAGAVAFSPDSKIVAAVGLAGYPGPPKIRLWDVATGQQLPQRFTEGNALPDPRTLLTREWEHVVAARIVFSPDGRTLAMCSPQRAIPVWETATGRLRLRLKGGREATVWVAFAPDARTLASSSWDGTIRLWDMDTGKELCQLTGHRGKVNSVAFSPDGKVLVSGGDDTTVLIWDVAGVTQRPRPRPHPLSAGDWETHWAELAGGDAAQAYRGMVRLIRDPQRTVPSLTKRLHPVPPADPRRLAQLLADLDSTRYAVRKKATRELEALGDAATPPLNRALIRTQASLELHLRVEQILQRLAIPSGDRLQHIRAVEVLEHIATPEAREVLATLAKGIPEARLTQEARASLKRLATGTVARH